MKHHNEDTPPITDCLFCKILNGEIPSKKIYEDDNFVAILDIYPIRRGHAVLLPKNITDGYKMLNLLKNIGVLHEKLPIYYKQNLAQSGCNFLHLDIYLTRIFIFFHDMKIYKEQKCTLIHQKNQSLVLNLKKCIQKFSNPNTLSSLDYSLY